MAWGARDLISTQVGTRQRVPMHRAAHPAPGEVKSTTHTQGREGRQESLLPHESRIKAAPDGRARWKPLTPLQGPGLYARQQALELRKRYKKIGREGARRRRRDRRDARERSQVL